MAGTATNWNVANITKTSGQLWANLAIPAAGARLTLDVDGTPDATANPNAIHLGMTREGASFLVKPTLSLDYADEFPSPIKTDIDSVEMAISAELLQVVNTAFLELLTPGVGTKSTGSGYEQVSFGTRSLVYSSVALIFPTETDKTKFAVYHLYKAINEQGIELSVGRKKMAGIPILFKGYAIVSRAVADTTGSFWKQTA